MSQREVVQQSADDPERLELAYQDALKSGEADEFAAAIHETFEVSAGNLLYAAWHYRLLHATREAARRAIAWSWAIPLALANGLVLWLISDDTRFSLKVASPLVGRQFEIIPAVVLLAAPITAASIAIFATAAGSRRWRSLVAVGAVLAVSSGYVLVTYGETGPRVLQQQYLTLMVLHLGLIAWAALGWHALYDRHAAASRFAFLAKSLEFIVVAGLFGITLALLSGVTFSLFSALGVQVSDLVLRLFLAGGSGLIAVLSAALVYDPKLDARDQSFGAGPGAVVATILRVMLIPALIILVVYLGFIPFNWKEPFENRDVLISFNAALFAVVALVAGVMPKPDEAISGGIRSWLRRGVVALVLLALVVGVYALAAILYRTWLDRLTPNRLTFVGWNAVNIGVLLYILVKQYRATLEDWVSRMQEVFSKAAVAYVVWAALTTVLLPWSFSIDQGDVSELPSSVQRIVYEEPYPILLKCYASPHIYLLDGGEKHWVQDIPTFEAQGFRWRNVHQVPCEDIEEVPSGEPIPPDAGAPIDD